MYILKSKTLVFIICISILSSNILRSTRLQTLTPSPSLADAVQAPPPSAFEGWKTQLANGYLRKGGLLMVNWLISEVNCLIIDG